MDDEVKAMIEEYNEGINKSKCNSESNETVKLYDKLVQMHLEEEEKKKILTWKRNFWI